MIDDVEGLGVILVAHGSKYQAANDMLIDVAREFQAATGVAIVEIAHMELAEPTLAQAYARSVARGAKRIVIQPYFLAPGRHSTTDIPRMTRDAAAPFPEVAYFVADPLGVDRRIADIMAARIREALEQRNAPGDGVES